MKAFLRSRRSSVPFILTFIFGWNVLFFVFIIQLLSSSESSEPRSAICYSMSAFYYLNLCNLISYMFLKNTICKENRKFFQLTISLEGRLELSDFFSQWTRGKMKIRLEKPAVNISNLTGSKNEKARRGALHEKLRLDLFFFFYREQWMEIKITEYAIFRQEAF